MGQRFPKGRAHPKKVCNRCTLLCNHCTLLCNRCTLSWLADGGTHTFASRIRDQLLGASPRLFVESFFVSRRPRRGAPCGRPGNHAPSGRRRVFIDNCIRALGGRVPAFAPIGAPEGRPDRGAPTRGTRETKNEKRINRGAAPNSSTNKPGPQAPNS